MSTQGPSITLNQIPNEPTLRDLLDLLKKDILLSFNSHHIATIESFDSGVGEQAPRATATINYPKTFFRPDSTGNYVAVQQSYPVLIDCPVIVLGGGPTSLTFPIAKGDQCLVLFNDRDLDNWFQGGKNAPVASSRLHAFPDGIVLVGLNSDATPFTNYDATRAVLQNGTTGVGVGPSLVKIYNATYTLNGILQNLITQIKSLVSATAAITVSGVTTGGSASGPPVNAATITAINTQLTTTATQLGDLLE